MEEFENALFSIVHIAFVAGWLAAGGDPPMPQKVIKIVRNDFSKINQIIETDSLK